MAAENLEEAKKTPDLLGRSLIALIIAKTGGINNDGEKIHALEQLEIVRDTAPDLRLIFMANGSPSRFEQFVKDRQRDLYPLQISLGPGENIQSQTNPVVLRIQEEPRRLINHKCGSKWDNSEGGTHSMVQYIQPTGTETYILIINHHSYSKCIYYLFFSEIVHYKLAPNYFFGRQDNQKIKIQGSGFDTLTICHSRKEHPR